MVSSAGCGAAGGCLGPRWCLRWWWFGFEIGLCLYLKDVELITSSANSCGVDLNSKTDFSWTLT